MFGQNRKTLAALFFALLFFLSSADVVFAIRIHGFNFRFGQALLLLAALPIILRLFNQIKDRSPQAQTHLSILIPWIPFFTIYEIAALSSATPFPTTIKWGWGLFNIILAAVICLDKRGEESLERGFEWGIVLIAGFIWLEAVALYFFGSFTSFQDLGPGMPGAVSFFSIPIGFAQESWRFMGFQTYRPNAFYFEPSYAGCALTFAFLCLFSSDIRRPLNRSGWIPALVVSSVIITSSRTGIISEFVFLTLMILFLVVRRRFNPLWRVTVRTILIAVLFMGLFCISPQARRYLQFITGPIGVDSTARIHQKGSSEGDRLSNAKDSFALWMQHPVLGNGVTPQVGPNNSQGLSQFSMVTWTEIGLESGTLGVLAFLFAVLSNMATAWKKSPDADLKTIVFLAWLIHFSIQFLLSQTFPRLDYWLIFFLSIRLLLKSGEPGSNLPSTGGTVQSKL
jgi:hypothetical protein